MSKLRGKIAEGVLFGSVSNIVIKAFSAVGYILILKDLSPHDYGVFVLLISVVGPASVFILLGFDRVYVSHLATYLGRKEFSKIKGLYSEYALACAILAFVFFVGIYFIRNLLESYYDFYLSRHFLYVCLFIFSQILMNFVSLFLEGCQRFKEVSYIQTLESVSRTLIIIAVFFSPSLTIGSLFVIYSVVKILSSLLGFFYVSVVQREYLFKNVKREKGVLLSIFKEHGKWDFFRNVFELAVQPLKLIIIKVFVNIESVAIYDFAKNIYSVVSSAFPVKSVIFPAIARSVDKKEVIFRIVEKSKKYMGIFYIVSFVAILVATPPVVRMVFPQYQGLEYVIYLTSLRLFVDLYKIGQDALLYAFNRQAFMFKVQPFFIAISIILDIVFAKAFGLVGVLISWHLYALITGFVQNRYLFNVVGVAKVKWKDLMQFDNYDKEILSSILGRIRGFSRWG